MRCLMSATHRVHEITTPVPNYDEYSYAVVKNGCVLVDPTTRRIVRVIP
jgi:Protein of unknown function (DUF1236)